jgi:DNA primase
VAGRIRDEDIALVRERSPIDAVIGEYVPLRNAGGDSLMGLCPFHDEKSSSFHVTPSRGLFYCFGCQESGDVISFLQKIEHLSFAEAIERLAVRAGIELRYEQGGYVPGQQQSQRSRLLEAHKVAAEFYVELLSAPAAATGRRFLAERGFEREDAQRFGVGYAPAEWEALVRHLRGRGFTDREMIIGGLAKEGRRGPMDRFRDRLIWPIRDLSGEVIGFGARRLGADDDGPKYLNTPETPIYKKGSVLYGVDLAKKEIARNRQAVIVEGYTDVMACHLAGVGTAIATCGTSFGEDHIKILRRLLMDQSEFRGEVIFTFDGDEAGQRAAMRASSLEHRFVTQTYVAVQPDGLDPCDLRVTHGDSAVRDLVASRVPLFEFAIRSVIGDYDLDTNEGRMAALDAAAPRILQIKDRGLRERYAKDLDRWLGILDEEFVMRRVREHANRRQGRTGAGGRDNGRGGAPGLGAADRGSAAAGSGPPCGVRPAYDPSDPSVRVEREALKLALQRPALAGPAFDALEATVFRVPQHTAVREVIAAAGGVVGAPQAGTGAEWTAGLREAAPDDEIRGLITQLAVEPPRSSGDPDDRYVAEVLARVQELQITREVTGLKSKLARLNPVENDTEYRRLFGQMVALEQRKRVLRERGIGGL